MATNKLKTIDITVKSLSEVTLTSSQPVPVGLMVGISQSYSTWAITVQNTQSDPTPAPFQLLLQLNLQGIIPSASVSNLLSLLFCADKQCAQPLYAWIESYSSDLSAVNIWVLLPNGIPANSQITFYMAVTGNNNYPYTGVAPQLTSTYAQYDNGENVFIFYDNFAGTSLNTNKWTLYNYCGTVTVNNGITMEFNSQTEYDAIVTNTGFSPQTIFDAYLASASIESGHENSKIGIGVEDANSESANGYLYLSWNNVIYNDGTIEYNEGFLTITMIENGPNFPNSGNAVLSGYWLATGNEGFGVNYQFVTTTNNAVSIGSANYYALGGFESPCPATCTWQWARVRAMPPNNVMPSLVSFTKIS